MRIIFLFIFILLINICDIKAQNTNYITGLGSVRTLAISDNSLFVSDGVSNGRIMQYDITDSSPVQNIIFSNTGGAIWDFALHGNDLYFRCMNYSDDIYSIYKFDITETSPNLETVYITNNPIINLAFHNDDLYFYDHGNNYISKIDVTSSNPVAINVFEWTRYIYPQSMKINDGILYVGHYDEIIKFDLSVSSPIEEEFATGFGNPYDLVFRENHMYILDLNDELLKINFNNYPITPIGIQALHPASNDMAFHSSGDLYVSKIFGTVYKFSNEVLGTSDFEFIKNTRVFPNPSKDFISLSNITKSYNFKILNILGMEISNGLIEPNDEIDIRNLKNGIYILILENGYNQKFVKN